MLHPQLDFDRTYFRRTSGGRKLIGLEEGVRDEEMGLAYYILNSTEPMQKTVEREEVLKKEIEEDHKREDWEKEDQAPSGPDIASIKQDKSEVRGHAIGWRRAIWKRLRLKVL